MRCVIGVGDDCDVQVVDRYASAHHALVVFDGATGLATVADLGSTNGTWVERDGSRTRVTAPTPLRRGDTLIVGRTRITWREGGRP